jgi:hypothetical protein
VYIGDVIMDGSWIFLSSVINRNLRQVSKKIPINMVQNYQHIGLDSYPVSLEYKSHAYSLGPNGLSMLETHTVCAKTWTSICEISMSMAN